MSRRAELLMIVLAGVFAAGLIHVFLVRFAAGDVYPDYSSMKAAPEGAKLLYDALARTPGVKVERNYAPPALLDQEHGAAILFLGLNLLDLANGPETYERLAERGNRVVLALTWMLPEKPAKAADLEKRWHVKLAVRRQPDRSYRVAITEGAEWQAMERDFGKGTIVLFGSADDFGNDATVRMDRLGVVSRAIGANSRVIFDEQHFGLTESGTVVGLARHFRLGGMAVGLGICAALFLWKSSASFPPAGQTARVETLAGRTSMAGLVTLLSRHIPPGDLAAACWREWLVTHRADLTPARRERAETILRERGRQPLEAAREIQTVLEAKGTS